VQIRGHSVRALMVERMLMEMPHKTRNDVVAHEEWMAARKFFSTQRQ
jgi:hypothetical protein